MNRILRVREVDPKDFSPRSHDPMFLHGDHTDDAMRVDTNTRKHELVNWGDLRIGDRFIKFGLCYEVLLDVADPFHLEG